MVLLDPGLYGTTIVDEEIQVPVPDGSTTIEPSQRLSELQLLFMLDAWLPWDMARSAIDEWTGGGYVSYERADGTVCFSAIAQFARSAERLNTALTWWAGAAGSTAVPLIEGNRVSFSSCDRGPGAAAPPAQDISTLSSLGFEYAYVRQSVESATAAGSATTPAVMRAIATCEARALASDTTTVPLLLLDVIPQDQMPLVDAVRTTADAACAAPPGV
jgi:hypothetical protein